MSPQVPRHKIAEPMVFVVRWSGPDYVQNRTKSHVFLLTTCQLQCGTCSCLSTLLCFRRMLLIQFLVVNPVAEPLILMEEAKDWK
jgi:hypothetical protein